MYLPGFTCLLLPPRTGIRPAKSGTFLLPNQGQSLGSWPRALPCYTHFPLLFLKGVSDPLRPGQPGPVASMRVTCGVHQGGLSSACGYGAWKCDESTLGYAVSVRQTPHLKDLVCENENIKSRH